MSDKKHFTKSTTVWSMAIGVAVCVGVSILAHVEPTWVPKAIADAADGAAVAAITAIAFRFRSLTFTRAQGPH